MALANLKKRLPSAERKQVNVDEFIEGAQLYCNGIDSTKIVPLASKQRLEQKAKPSGHEAQMKRATFSLSEEAIQALADLSSETGIAKSRLIRIWLSRPELLAPEWYQNRQLK